MKPPPQANNAAPASGPAGADAPEDVKPSSRCAFALFGESGQAYVDKIIVGERLRGTLDPKKVDEFAASIRRIGLINPIVVTPAEPVEVKLRGRKMAYMSQLRLVAGWYRLEAVKKLGRRAIPANVVPLGARVAEIGEELCCKLWEIDENLVRAELTQQELGEHLAARKAIYEQLHPETKAGAAQALGMNQALGHDVTANLAPTFTEDTATKTGLSGRTIERHIQRHEKIAPEVADEIRTIPEIADKGVELDGLAKLELEQQREAVKAVKQGKAPSVRDWRRSEDRERSYQNHVRVVRRQQRSEFARLLSDMSGPVLMNCLDDLVRILRDQEPRLADIPKAKRMGVAQRILDALDGSAEGPINAAPYGTDLVHLAFDEALSQFKAWYAALTPDQQHQVEDAMGDAEAVIMASTASADRNRRNGIDHE